MAAYEIVPATAALARDLAPRLREADRLEVWAASRMTPLDALRASLEASPDPRAGLADGRVACIFGIGVRSVLSDYGVPWMLGSEDVVRHARRFLRGSRDYIAEMRNKYSRLENYVDARNVDAIKWLAWLGFTLEAPEPFGVERLPFHRFHWERQHV